MLYEASYNIGFFSSQLYICTFILILEIGKQTENVSEIAQKEEIAFMSTSANRFLARPTRKTDYQSRRQIEHDIDIDLLFKCVCDIVFI